MLDLKFIRENTELVREALEKRSDSAPLDEILELDAERREKVTKLEELRRQRKEMARQRQGDGESSDEGRDLRFAIKEIEDEVRAAEERLNEMLLQVPNVPHESVPLGKTDEDNVTVRTWGKPKKFTFKPLPHWELGEKLGLIDFDAGVRLSGSRFYVLRGLGARLQRSLITFMLDLHTREQDYLEIYPPYMVKKEVMQASGQLPKFLDNLYHDEEDDYWFVPTAEVPVTSLHAGEIIPPGMLPYYYTAYTACFRREKMSAGRDTRGIKRGHQFDKVEMYKFTEEDSAFQELERMLNDAEEVCKRLDLPYRVRELCTGDLGFSAVKSYDIDVWAPGCEEWLEVSSCSNCGDFQGRRANVRYRPSADERPRFVHTLNGSGLALPRIMIAVMENYQQQDGSINVPDALQPFVGEKVITGS